MSLNNFVSFYAVVGIRIMKNIVKELFKIADKISEFITEPYIYHYYYEPDELESEEEIKDWIRKKVEEEEKKEARVFKFAQAEKRDVMSAFEDALDDIVTDDLLDEFGKRLYSLIIEGLDSGKLIYEAMSGIVEEETRR